MDAQTIGIIIVSVLGTILLCALIFAILLCVRIRRKQKQAYVRIAIEKSLRRQVVMGPTLSEKREDALMNARFYIRNSPFDLVSPMWNIGSCDKKYHFHVKGRRNKESYVLTLQVKGEESPVPLQNLSTRAAVRGLLRELKHPYILPSVECDFLQGQKVVLLTVRPFSKRGSLRDMLYKSKPHKTFTTKYCDPGRKARPLAVKYIRQFGRQILEAMSFLQVHDYPYPDLHCGNVILSGDGVCQLTDYEKPLLGQTPHYGDFTQDQTQIRDFGCLLFELACGFEPSRKDIKYPPQSISSDVKDIIQSIFFGETSPTLDDLISLPFFDVKPRGLTSESGEETDMKPEYIELLTALRGGQAPAQRKKKQRKPSAPPTTPSAATQPLLSDQPIPAPPPSASWGSSAPSKPPATTTDRASLLSDIRGAGSSGAKLRKVEEVNDRSAPRI